MYYEISIIIDCDNQTVQRFLDLVQYLMSLLSIKKTLRSNDSGGHKKITLDNSIQCSILLQLYLPENGKVTSKLVSANMNEI